MAAACIPANFMRISTEPRSFLHGRASPAVQILRHQSRNGGSLRLAGRRRGGVSCASEVPDFLPASWKNSERANLIGPSSEFTAEEAVLRQLDALNQNDEPYPDHGVEVMYRFAGFDPFQRSQYFGPFFDLGQFERFRRIFHHSTYRVLLGHKDRRILSSLYTTEHSFKQRVWVGGSRPGKRRFSNSLLFRELEAVGTDIG